MPISEKIQEEIEKTGLSSAEMDLLRSILEVEDAGVYRFQQEYDKRIRAHIEALGEENSNGDSD